MQFSTSATLRYTNYMPTLQSNGRQCLRTVGSHAEPTSCVMQIERQLGNIERVRTLYEKYLEHNPANCTAWCKLAEFEAQFLGETDRARAVYELAIAQPVLDMPEVLWKVCLCSCCAQTPYLAYVPHRSCASCSPVVVQVLLAVLPLFCLLLFCFLETPFFF